MSDDQDPLSLLFDLKELNPKQYDKLIELIDFDMMETMTVGEVYMHLYGLLARIEHEMVRAVGKIAICYFLDLGVPF